MSLGKILDRYAGIPLLYLVSLFPVSKKPKKKILFIKLRGMGDVVLTLPSVKLAKDKYPEYEIHYLTEEGVAVAEASGLVDKVIPFKVKSFFSTVSSIRKEEYEIVVDFEQFVRLSSIIARMSGAPVRIGFDSPGQYRKIGYTYPVKYKDIHTVEVFASPLRPLGITKIPGELVSLKYSREYEKWAKGLGADIVIHPGSGDTGLGRRWPVNRFAKLINLLAKDGYRIAITGGPSETGICNEVYSLVKNKVKGQVVNLSGRTNLKQLFALYDSVKLVISNDTGPMHIAAAQKSKVIGLFGPNLPERYMPYCQDCEYIYHKVNCSPCINIQLGQVPKCWNIIDIEEGQKASLCMSKISIEEVYDLAKKMLKIKKK